MPQIGKLLIVSGLILVAAGVIFLVGQKVIPFGRLPGDISWHRGNFSVYFPIVTCIVASLLLTIILNLFARR